MLLDFTYDLDEELSFIEGEYVSFEIESVRPIVNGFILDCLVLSGDNYGKTYAMILSHSLADGRLNYFTLKFLQLFYSSIELTSGIEADKLIGKRFNAKATVKEVLNKKYINWSSYKSDCHA